MAHTFEVDGIYYKISSNEAIVTFKGAAYNSYNDEYSGSVTIPSSVTYNGTTYPVTQIDNNTFSGCTSLTNVTIPNSITHIGTNAFQGCSGLTSIEIPYSVTYLGLGIFNGCSSLASVFLPNSITDVSWYMFYGCSSLTSVNIPNSVTDIGFNAFYGCSSLTSVNIPNSVTKILSDTFYGCSSLTNIEIPDSVTEIGKNAFYDCSSLTSIEIPDLVTEIGDCAFYRCSSLTNVTIGNSVAKIGFSAFHGCNALETLNYNAVNCDDFISDFPFEGLNITTINIGDHVEKIPANFGYKLKQLKNLTIGKSVAKIGIDAFYICTGLETLNYNAVNCADFYYYPPFYYSKDITTINIGNQVERIPAYFAYGLTSLTNIELPNSLTEIGKSAFYGCRSLTNIELPNSLTEIGESAFYGCSGLTSITIPNSVTSIGTRAFSSNTLNKITVNNGNSYYDSRDDCNAIIETWNNHLIIGCQNTIIPNSVNSIGNYAFFDCSGLTSVNIGNSVTSIGESAFYGCSGLTSITIPNSVTHIGDRAFLRCSGLDTLNFNAVNCANFYYYPDSYVPPFYGEHISTINIGNQVERIPAYFAFHLGRLTSIKIPNSVNEISNYAFDGCNSLTSVTCSAVRPPVAGSSCFSNTVYNTATLYVPKESITLYWVSNEWNKFKTIKEITVNVGPGDVNGDGEVNIGDINSVVNAILNDITDEAYDVNGDGEINIADINVIVQNILGLN